MPFAPVVTDCRSCPLGVAAGRDGCPFTACKHAPGKRLIARGKRDARVTFIKRGYCVVTTGDRQPPALRAPGAIVGWEYLTTSASRHSLTSLTETETCSLDPVRFRAFASTRGNALLPLLAAELEQRDCEASYTRGPAQARVARFLRARLRAGGGAYPLEFQCRDLARILDLRAETVSRVLRTLRARGVVGAGRGLFIKDALALDAFANGSPRERRDRLNEAQ